MSVDILPEPDGTGSIVIVENAPKRSTVVLGDGRGPRGPVGPSGGSNALQIDVVAGATLPGHSLVTPQADGTVLLADPTDPAGIYLPVWMVTGAIVNGATGAALVEGPITEPSWSWTAGAPLFLSSTGQLTATVPAAPGYAWLLLVGVAITPTTVQFDPLPPILLNP